MFGISLQRARRLQRADIGRHLCGEPEARDEYAAHHDQQYGTDTGGNELSATLCAREFHGKSRLLSVRSLPCEAGEGWGGDIDHGGAKRIAVRAGTSVGTPLIASGSYRQRLTAAMAALSNTPRRLRGLDADIARLAFRVHREGGR